MDDFAKMGVALEQARRAALLGEVPVGAAVFHGDTLVAAAHNRRELDKNAMAHAEILAMDAACRMLGGWRLHACDLYVTLEPCAMCMGAAINARIRHIYYGARDPKAGCAGSICDLAQMPFNHKPVVTGGLCGEECGALLSVFFARLREKRKEPSRLSHQCEAIRG